MDSKDKFAQMLTEGYKALDPDREEREYIRELLHQREQQRKKRIRTITALAAAFLIVIGAVFAVGGCIGPAEADKNDRTKVEKQGDNVIISDENADGQEVMAETASTTDWDKVEKLKKKYPEMITFTDIPEGMEFVSVEITENGCNTVNVEYKFSKDTESVLILQEYYTKKKQETQGTEIPEEVINYKGYEVHIVDNKNMSTAKIGKTTVDILGVASEKELFNILDKVRT